MSSLALALILAAAFIHVVPHAAIKGAQDRTAFVWWMLAGNALFYAPLLWLDAMPSPRAWLFIVASGLVETGYLLAISRAYASGDLSVAYPLARGSAPLFLLLFTTTILHERLTAFGIFGILLIAVGVYFVNVARFGQLLAPLQSLALPSPRWALAAGAMTAIYTTLDKVGVRLIHPLTYIYLVLVVTLLAYTPVALLRSGWPAMRGTVMASPWRVLVAAATMPLAYGLVLIAMRLGTPASYAGSVREVSVIVASLLGVLLFGERVTPPRVVGAAAIVAGILLIACNR